jgi:phage major head subunit gpT-like protein
MLRLSSDKLSTVNVGFKANFNEGLTDAAARQTYQRVATIVPSTTREEEYGYLVDIPQIREWLGDRQVNSMKLDGYKIKNRNFELTISVNANDLNDDRVGIYAPRMKMLGNEVARFPDRLVYELLKAGFTTNCFDGQPFFDTDHPYTKEDGTMGTQSNYLDGAATPWFLLCTTMPLKPLIYQERADFRFVALDQPTDPNVFMRSELLYGVDGRANVGFWQMAVGSKAALTDVNLKAARQMMESLLGEHGKPLGLTCDILVCPPSLRDDGTVLVEVPTLANGGGNPLYKAAELIVTPYLI